MRECFFGKELDALGSVEYVADEHGAFGKDLDAWGSAEYAWIGSKRGNEKSSDSLSVN